MINFSLNTCWRLIPTETEIAGSMSLLSFFLTVKL